MSFRRKKGGKQIREHRAQVAATPVPYVDRDAPEILKTTDFALFAFDPRNRQLADRDIEDLFFAVMENNLLHVNPILTERRDGKLFVIDGQRRLTVAQKMGLPIYYIVSDGSVRFEHVTGLNTSSKHWRIDDYMHRWVTEGKPEYLRLQAFVDEYPFLTLAIAVRLCMSSDSTDCDRAFQDGKYICDNLVEAERLCRCISDFEPYARSFWKQRGFVTAMRILVAHPRYDHEKMLGKLEYLSRKMVRCPDTQTYLEMLVSIYNYRTQRIASLYIDMETVRKRRKSARAYGMIEPAGNGRYDA